MANTNSKISGGMGLYGLLTIAFIVLKLCSVIAWSWWWVFSPLWIPFAAVAAIVIFVFLVLMFCVLACFCGAAAIVILLAMVAVFLAMFGIREC